MGALAFDVYHTGALVLLYFCFILCLLLGWGSLLVLFCSR